MILIWHTTLISVNLGQYEIFPLVRTISSYTTVRPPVRGDNPQNFSIARELSPVRADKPGYNYFIPPLLVQTLLRMKYFMLKIAISGKGGIS